MAFKFKNINFSVKQKTSEQNIPQNLLVSNTVLGRVRLWVKCIQYYSRGLVPTSLGMYTVLL